MTAFAVVLFVVLVLANLLLWLYVLIMAEEMRRLKDNVYGPRPDLDGPARWSR